MNGQNLDCEYNSLPERDKSRRAGAEAMDGVPRLKWPNAHVRSVDMADGVSRGTVLPVSADVERSSGDPPEQHRSQPSSSSTPAPSHGLGTEGDSARCAQTASAEPFARLRTGQLAEQAKEFREQAKEVMASPERRDEVLTKVVRGAGFLLGSGKEAIKGGIGALGKGAVAAVDVAYERAAPRVLPTQKRLELEARMSLIARTVSAEMAPRLGALFAEFKDGAEEGNDGVRVQIDRMVDRIIPEKAQRDINARIEKRVGAMMQHLVEPAAEEALRGVYLRRLKPYLVQDRRAPMWWRLSTHDTMDQLWADILLEMPTRLNNFVEGKTFVARAVDDDDSDGDADADQRAAATKASPPAPVTSPAAPAAPPVQPTPPPSPPSPPSAEAPPVVPPSRELVPTSREARAGESTEVDDATVPKEPGAPDTAALPSGDVPRSELPSGDVPQSGCDADPDRPGAGAIHVHVHGSAAGASHEVAAHGLDVDARSRGEPGDDALAHGAAFAAAKAAPPPGLAVNERGSASSARERGAGLGMAWRGLLRARAFLLYNFLPFDNTFWGRMRSLSSVVVFIAAAFPSWWSRTAFYATLLACLSFDLDE